MTATIMSKKRVKTSLTLTVNAETSAFVVALPHRLKIEVKLKLCTKLNYGFQNWILDPFCYLLMPSLLEPLMFKIRNAISFALMAHSHTIQRCRDCCSLQNSLKKLQLLWQLTLSSFGSSQCQTTKSKYSTIVTPNTLSVICMCSFSRNSQQ